MVITGCSAWTVYQYDNYQGSSLCLYPSDLTNCYPGFYPEPADLGFFAGQASSARRGCFSNKKVMPKSIPKGKFATKQEFTYVPDVEGQ